VSDGNVENQQQLFAIISSSFSNLLIQRVRCSSRLLMFAKRAIFRCFLHIIKNSFSKVIYHLFPIYQVRQNKVAPKSFSLFSQQPFGILISNSTHLFSEMFYM